jgi:hypothetical protein
MLKYIHPIIILIAAHFSIQWIDLHLINC